MIAAAPPGLQTHPVRNDIFRCAAAYSMKDKGSICPRGYSNCISILANNAEEIDLHQGSAGKLLSRSRLAHRFLGPFASEVGTVFEQQEPHLNRVAESSSCLLYSEAVLIGEAAGKGDRS